MKKLTIILAFVAMLSVMGCTQNNGHIGHWFGLWKVARVTIDGQDDADYKGNVFFAFQGAVFGVGTQGGITWYGRWEESEKDNCISIEMNTEVDQSQLPSYDYLHIYVEKNMLFRLVSHKGSDKVLEYVGPDGKTYVYYLKKW